MLANMASNFAKEIEAHRRAIRKNPRDARAHALLGLTLQELGKLEEAVAAQSRAIQLDPTLTALYETIAPALHALGKHEAAVDTYRRALRIHKDNATMHAQLSGVLYEIREFDEASASALRAIALEPDNPAFHLSLAKAQHALNGDEKGAEYLRQVLALAPDHVEALVSLGKCQHNLKQYDAAVASFERALEIQPDDPEVLCALGAAKMELKRPESACVVLRQALQLAPDHGRVHILLAQACFELGWKEQALRHAQRALELHPDDSLVHSMNLFMLSHCCADPAELTAAHFEFGERWDVASWASHANQRDPNRRLNIGFVSADLYNHAVATFIGPVLGFLQHSEGLTLHVYDNGRVADSVTEELRGFVAHWHSITGLDDEALERKIRADGIDILVDLSGHSARNRLPVFARKPAPVQVSWIGYGGTTGLKTMDYYLADQFLLPERYDNQFTEKVVRLPLGAPFSPSPHAPPVNQLPALTNGYLTFGSFHRANKLSREVIAHWAQLLRALPDSKMLLGGLKEGANDELLDWFDKEGIDRDRLILRWRAPMAEYLAQHHEVDICLSPFPYTGTTTVGHAIWMGVPTLATVGPTNPSHAVACYMAHLGLHMFIAQDDATFVKLGTLLAENHSMLATLRASMRERFTGSLVGYPGIASAAVEHAFRMMWQRWCADLPPAPLRIRLSDLGLGSEQNTPT